MKKFIIVVLAVAVSMFGTVANALTPQEEADVREAQEVLNMIKEDSARVAKNKQLLAERTRLLQEELERLQTANKKLLQVIQDTQ